MTDLKPALLSLLSPLPAAVTAAWPLEEIALPVITVAEASSSVLAQADGQPYLEEHVYDVRVLSGDRVEADSLARAADAALSSLGLRRAACRDQFDEAARAYVKEMAYRAVLRGDTIYGS